MPSAAAALDDSGNHITEFLHRLGEGQPEIEASLIPLVYSELRRLAHSRLGRERSDHTLQTTALVHEAWIRLSTGEGVQWKNRNHFFAVCAEIMNRILVDYARRRRSQKRGGTRRRVDLNDNLALTEESLDTILMVQEALDKLRQEDPRQAQVVVLRIYAGMTNQQVADALGISERQVKRDWEHAQVALLENF